MHPGSVSKGRETPAMFWAVLRFRLVVFGCIDAKRTRFSSVFISALAGACSHAQTHCHVGRPRGLCSKQGLPAGCKAGGPAEVNDASQMEFCICL